VFAALAVAPVAWFAIYFGFHETDTIWFTGTQCANYPLAASSRGKYAPADLVREVNARLGAFSSPESVSAPAGQSLHVCGDWRVHRRARQALAELGVGE
jgi:hypothetical protein